MTITALQLAQRFIGLREVSGVVSNPQVLAMLRVVDPTVKDDGIAWCSAFTNYIAWALNLPRSNSLAARSWLGVGTPVPIAQATPGFDVVIFKRGQPPQPGPEVLKAQGHVAFFAGLEGDRVLAVGGNQGDAVSLAHFHVGDVLGVRRLA